MKRKTMNLKNFFDMETSYWNYEQNGILSMLQIPKQHLNNLSSSSEDQGEVQSASGNLAHEIAAQRLRLFNSGRKNQSNRKRGRSSQSHNKNSTRGVTQQFVCLASKDQFVVLSGSENEIMNNAGLGRKKIRLNREDNENAVLEKIMSEEVDMETNEPVGFPQLRGAGGFELLRSTQNCRELKLIECRWTTKELQKNVNSQSTIYVRPIQKNLSTVQKNVGESSIVLKTMCSKCGNEFPLLEMRTHIEVCIGDETQDTQESSHENNVSSAQLTKDSSEVNTGIPTVDISQLVTENSTVDISQLVTENSTVDISQLVTENPTVYIRPFVTENPIRLMVAENHTVDIRPLVTQNEEIMEQELPSLRSPETTQNNIDSSVSDIVKTVVDYCKEYNITYPVEILRKMQKEMITGRPLEVEDITQCSEGDTNYILINRDHLLATAFDELKFCPFSVLRRTLEVQFYDELASDYGGPRKEFFSIVLQEIYQKYVENGFRELLANDYETVGKICALSILQNGKIPRFMGDTTLKELFESESPSECVLKLRRGIDNLGIYKVCKQLPAFVFLFHPTNIGMTFRRITSILEPEFDIDGSNKKRMEKRHILHTCDISEK